MADRKDWGGAPSGKGLEQVVGDIDIDAFVDREGPEEKGDDGSDEE